MAQAARFSLQCVGRLCYRQITVAGLRSAAGGDLETGRACCGPDGQISAADNTRCAGKHQHAEKADARLSAASLTDPDVLMALFARHAGRCTSTSSRGGSGASPS